MSNELLGYINYKTDAIVYKNGPPSTDEEARQYIPQTEAAQTLYTICRKRGKTIIDSMIEVLENSTIKARKTL